MTLASSVLRALAAAGCTADQLILAVEAAEREDEEKLLKRREQNRIRQQNFRDRNAPSRSVTQITRDERYTPSSDKEKPPTPPKEINSNHIPPSPPKGGSSPAQIEQQIFTAYSEMAQKAGLSTPRSMTEARRKAVLARVHESGIDAVLEAIKCIGESSFCRGKNDRGWRADFDFLCQAKSFTALLEGKYEDRKIERAPPPLTPWQQHQKAGKDAFDRKLGLFQDDHFASDTIDLESADWRAH